MTPSYLIGFFAKCAQYGLGSREALVLLNKVANAPFRTGYETSRTPKSSIIGSNTPQPSSVWDGIGVSGETPNPGYSPTKMASANILGFFEKCSQLNLPCDDALTLFYKQGNAPVRPDYTTARAKPGTKKDPKAVYDGIGVKEPVTEGDSGLESEQINKKAFNYTTPLVTTLLGAGLGAGVKGLQYSLQDEAKEDALKKGLLGGAVRGGLAGLGLDIGRQLAGGGALSDEATKILEHDLSEVNVPVSERWQAYRTAELAKELLEKQRAMAELAGAAGGGLLGYGIGDLLMSGQ